MDCDRGCDSDRRRRRELGRSAYRRGVLCDPRRIFTEGRRPDHCLDFWLVKSELQLAVYTLGIDFGTKGYGNLVELAALQTRVAGELGVEVGTLTMTVKSAHIYETELGLMRSIIAATRG